MLPTSAFTRCLWEILVPTMRNHGKPYTTRFHRVWDAKVREISHGLTILAPAKGQWVHDAQLFQERMIPVRFLATRPEMEQIVEMTADYYDQLAVLCWKVSDDVILHHRVPKICSTKSSE